MNKTRACRRLHIRYAVGKFAHACGKSWPDHPRRRTSARVVLRSARRGAKLSPEEAVPLTDARQRDERRRQPRLPRATNNASNTRQCRPFISSVHTCTDEEHAAFLQLTHRRRMSHAQQLSTAKIGICAPNKGSRTMPRWPGQNCRKGDSRCGWLHLARCARVRTCCTH